MKEQLSELSPEAVDEEFKRMTIESDLATVGLAAVIEAHNDSQLPFGVGDFAQPVEADVNVEDLPTPKSSNQKQSDGTWATVIDGKD